MSGWNPTHWVPASGLDARASPDAAVAPTARLDPWLEVTVAQVWGDWAQVVCANGWWGWVDGRVLVPRTPAVTPIAASPAAGGPGQAVAGVGAAPMSGALPAAVAPRDTWADRAQTGWIALVGAAAVALSSLLPWLKIGGQSADGFDVPLQFLLSYDSTTDLGVDVGVLLIVLALAGAVAVLVAPSPLWRRGVGIAAVVVAGLYVLQVQRLLGSAPASQRPGLLSTLGFGVYVSLAGALALAFAPEWSRTQAES